MFKRQLFLITTLAFFYFIGFGKVYSEEYHKPTHMDPKVTYRIRTTNDEEFIGKFLDQDTYSIRIITEKRQLITIPQKEILRIYPIEYSTDKPEKDWFENPHSIFYYSSQSAFNMNKGECYYKNTYLLMNSLYVGLSDHISVGAGIEMLSTIVNLSEGKLLPAGFVSAQIGFKVDSNYNFGVVALYSGISGLTAFNNSNMGVLYAVGTLGSNDNNLSVGLGYGFLGGEFSQTMYFTLSGTLRLSQGFALITDNSLTSANYNNGSYSYGFRFIGKKAAFDLGLLNSSEISDVLLIGLPYLGLNVKF